MKLLHNGWGCVLPRITSNELSTYKTDTTMTKTNELQESKGLDAPLVRQRYLVSEVIFFEIKNGKIMDKRGTEMSTPFILKHDHYISNGWGYVIL